jgi:AcrR family transcriptional regulator
VEANSPRPSTRQIILETAFDLFLQQGYHGTSMRQLAAEAEITPATIYHHFEGKEEIFTALLTERLPHRALVQAIARAEGDSAEALVRDALRKMHLVMQERIDNFRLMFIEFLEFQGRHIGTISSEFLPGALDFIRRLQEANGHLRPFPPTLIVRALGGLFISYAITTAFLDQVPGFQEEPGDLEAMGEMLLHGLLAEKRAVETDGTPIE